MAPAAGTQTSAKTVRVVLKEWTLTPSVKQVPAGKVTFIVRNAGNLPHEFVVLRTSRHHHQLPMAGSQAKEAGLKGEIEGLGAGETRRLTLTLKAGKYVLLCNLPGHYKAGQSAAFTVR